MPCGDEGRDWSDVAEAKEYQRLSENRQKLRERHGTKFLSQSSEGNNPANTLIWDF